MWANRLASEEGLLVGPTSGAVVKVCNELAVRPEFKGKTIVGIVASSGIRYTKHPMWEGERLEAEADGAPAPAVAAGVLGGASAAGVGAAPRRPSAAAGAAPASPVRRAQSRCGRSAARRTARARAPTRPSGPPARRRGRPCLQGGGEAAERRPS